MGSIISALNTFADHWIILMELYPGFALYRGMEEFGSYAGAGKGLMWNQVLNGKSAMKEVLVIMIYEWFGMLFVAYYVDQIGSAGSGVPKNPLFFMKIFTKKPILQRQYSGARGQLEKLDVQQEVSSFVLMFNLATMTSLVSCIFIHSKKTYQVSVY